MKTPMVSPPAPRRTQPGITLRDEAFHVQVLGEISPESLSTKFMKDYKAA
jgi:hypothetical protein